NGRLRVRVIRWAEEGGNLLQLSQRYPGREDSATNRYGFAVTADAVLVGMDRESDEVESHGAGVIRPLERNAGGTDQFGEWPAISPSMDGGGSFGGAMAMEGRYLVVGDPARPAGGTDRGEVSVFR